MVQRGDKGDQVKSVQQLLVNAGYLVSIDGIFGPATEAAVKDFQKKNKLEVDGQVGPNTLAKLQSYKAPHPKQSSLASKTLSVAMFEMKSGAKEVGGNNMGPWVKKYTGGHEGPNWQWCAAYSTWCIRQAALPGESPFKERYSSSRLHNEAVSLGRFTLDIKKVYPGCMFLVSGGPTGWQHTGLVREVYPEHIITVEGNSRVPGETGVDHVCSRYRGLGALGFILV